MSPVFWGNIRPPQNLEEPAQFIPEEVNKDKQEVKYLKGKVEKLEDEIRAYRSHLKLPPKSANRMITGYDQLGRPKYKDGQYPTVEEELGKLIIEQNKPTTNTLIYQNSNTVNKGDVIAPEGGMPKRKDNILDSFGF